MIRLGRCFCPKCGKEHDSTGRLGTSKQCSCGVWISGKDLDRVRYYWIFQVAISFGIATYFLALALFFRDLPHDPWKRFFSPILQVPAVASFIVSYLSIVRNKRTDDDDTLMLKYYLWGILSRLAARYLAIAALRRIKTNATENICAGFITTIHLFFAIYS